MDERFENEIEEQLDDLRRQVRELEARLGVTPKRTFGDSPVRDITWNGQDGTLGAMLPKVGDLTPNNPPS